MIKICYIYKNEQTMFRVINRIQSSLGIYKNKLLNGTKKEFVYDNVTFVFLKYPCASVCINNDYIKVYIEKELKNKLTPKQLKDIYNFNKTEFITDGFCELN